MKNGQKYKHNGKWLKYIVVNENYAHSVPTTAPKASATASRSKKKAKKG